MIDPHRIFPPATEAQRADLKRSIEAVGLQKSLVVDDQKNVIDGHDRRDVCIELGIDWMAHAEVRIALNDNQKKALAIDLNMWRKPLHLSRAKRNELLDVYLMAHPELSETQVAELFGVNQSTIHRRKKKLMHSHKLPPVEATVGKDGIVRKIGNRVTVRSQKDYDSILPDIEQIEKNGVPELMEAVDAGKLSVAIAAKVAELPPEDQQESIRRGRLAEKRDPHDFYRTPERVTRSLLRYEQFSVSVREPANGDGAISNIFTEAGYDMDRSDLVDRGCCRVEDFLTSDRRSKSLATNPPYKNDEEFVKKALALTTYKVAMLLPITFLEGQKRGQLLDGACLKNLYIFVDRITFYKDGAKNRGNGRVIYAWFVWEHGYKGPLMTRRINSREEGPLLPPIEVSVIDTSLPMPPQTVSSEATAGTERSSNTVISASKKLPERTQPALVPKAEIYERKNGELQIWCGDSLSLMRDRISPKSVDVAVTSIPYNIGIKYGCYDDNRPEVEYLAWLDEVFGAVKAVLNEDGSFFLNVAPSQARRVAGIAERHFVIQNDISWIKSITVNGTSAGQFTPINSNRYLHHNWEHVLHLTKAGDVKLNRLAIGIRYEDQRNRNRTGADTRCLGNAWFIPHDPVTSKAKKWSHPCPFPIQLAKWCIRLHGRTDEMTVLDPFNGVGATTAAMASMCVNGIGIDIDPSYCQSALQRIDTEILNNLRMYVEDVYDLDSRVNVHPTLDNWAQLEKVTFDEALWYCNQLPTETKQLFIGGPFTAA